MDVSAVSPGASSDLVVNHDISDAEIRGGFFGRWGSGFTMTAVNSNLFFKNKATTSN
jgi:hypothetical protein